MGVLPARAFEELSRSNGCRVLGGAPAQLTETPVVGVGQLGADAIGRGITLGHQLVKQGVEYSPCCSGFCHFKAPVRDARNDSR